MIFQISPCTGPDSADVKEMRANLKRLQQRFPELQVPFDVIDPFPENYFSVPLHVQRTVTQETSRRLGRALHEIVFSKSEHRAPPADSYLTLRRAVRVDNCESEADIIDVFRQSCDGKGSRDIDLAQWRKLAKSACRSAYIAEFNCSDGPTRIVRQETEDRFGGRFRLACKTHDRWPRDDLPQGIQVADSSLAQRDGNPMGLATLRLKAFCDGLTSCDYKIKLMDASVKTADFYARWYCGSREQVLKIPDTSDGTSVHIACP